jgi:hypothetical protein
MLMIHGRTALGIATGLVLIGLGGCSGSKASREVAAMNTCNIQRLSNLYTAFQHTRGGTGPKSETEFKTFIAEFDAQKLSMMGVDPNDLTAAFTSERDGQPFRIKYNVNGGRGAVDAVVFEQKGADGKRQVGFTGGKIDEVNAADNTPTVAAEGTSGRQGQPPGGGRPVSTGPPPGAPTGPPRGVPPARPQG